MPKWVRRFTLLNLLLASSPSAWAAELSADQYPFPYQNSHLATILSKADRADVPFKRLHLEFRKDRENIPGFKGRSRIPMALFAHAGQTAPLAFVIAGTGGDAMSEAALLLASEFYQMGYHAITLPDPISEDYVLGRSESLLPGYLPRDSKEYYKFLQETVAALDSSEDLRISGYALAGYSYGALLSGFLMREDASENVFRFSKAVLINPPLDVPFGVKVLDGFYALGGSESDLRCAYVAGTLGSLIELIKKGAGANFALGMVHDSGVTDREMEWLIGASFHEKLGGTLFASQQIRDLGILKPSNPKDGLRRHKAALGVTFQRYMDEFVMPSLSAGGAAGEPPVENVDLYSLAGLLQSDPRIYVMENADDILLKPGDLDFLRQALGTRLYLYPYGGHVGNLSYPKNRADLRDIIR